MLAPKHGKFAAPLVLIVLIMIACGSYQEPTRWSEAEKDKGKSAVAKEAIAGGEFNKFFPKDKAKGDWDMVYKSEKKGYAEAALKKNGKDAAMLSVTDTVSNPEAKDKFKDSTNKLHGYPEASVGNLGTAVLVADRFQVQVRSVPGPAGLSKEEREEWLQNFNLDGLAKLNP